MKKAALCICAALWALCTLPIRTTARAAAIVYARLTTDCMLYDEVDAVCMLPATYFVLLEGEESAGRRPVAYADLHGYVAVSALEIVDYEPVTKYARVTAVPANDGLSVNLRARPDAATPVTVSVPADASLTLYGERSGTELFAGAGTSWQYVRYDGDKPYYGYAYGPQLKFTPPPPCVVEKVPEKQTEITETGASFSVSENGRIALIVCMCVPAGILMLVLFYRPESARTPRHKAQK